MPPASSPGSESSCRSCDETGPAERFETVYPGSRKVHVEGPRSVRVPFREVELTGDRDRVRLYDTSGPQGRDPREGLPEPRTAWIDGREAVKREAPRARPAGSEDAMPDGLRPGQVRRGEGTVTQMRYARKGIVTPEMEFAAIREGMAPSSSATRSPGAGPSSPPTSTIPSSSRWSSAGASG